MLLQFIVENFRSFHKETILNLFPVKSRIHPEHVIVSENGPKVRGLPLAVFYGANASGKSNLIRAIAFAQNLIIEGTRGENPIRVTPFLLGEESDISPSRFEFVIKHDGVLYTYGFLTTTNEIVEEWLFAKLNNRELRLFERITQDGKACLEFGSKLAFNQKEKDRLSFVAQGTRPNQLFLTEANERNVDTLKPIWHWFRNHLKIIWPNAIYSGLVPRAHGDKDFTEFLSSYLHVADTGIDKLALKSTKVDKEKFYTEIPEEERRELCAELERNPQHTIVINRDRSPFAIKKESEGDFNFMTIVAEHKKVNGSSVQFNMKMESDGTNRLMHLVPALLDLQTSDNTYLIDELDRSMHPLLCRLFVQAFLSNYNDNSNKEHGQILVSTHETSLLDLELLRRDEIWFIEKDQMNSSRLYSLAEFRTRADLSISKGYLNGRFGAIPFIGDVHKLYK